MDAAPLSVTRFEADQGWWVMCSRPPAPALRELVTTYHGYTEFAPHLLRRRHLPVAEVVLIIGFGEPLRFTSGDGLLVQAPRRSFIGALSDTYVVSEWQGTSAGIQAGLTPPGARMLLGRPMSELAGDVIELEELLGPAANLLAERLYEAPGWDERFSILDDVLAHLFARATEPRPGVRYAWERLMRSGGAEPIAALAEGAGWSRRRFTEHFHEEIGLPPKNLARVLRFNRALDLLGRPATGPLPPPRWSEVAAASGYYDQAHLVRDFRQFTGFTPTEFLRRRIAGVLDVLD
jgi:AraC-like DNA-binding protein